MAWQRRSSKKRWKSPSDESEEEKKPREIKAGTISSIESQKKNAKRISIFLDGKYAFGLHQDVLLQNHLYSGLQLDVLAIEQLIQADALLRAKEAAVTYLGHRARSESEVQKKLSGKGFDEEIIQIVINRLHELSYLDDERFALNYTRDRFSNKGYGPQRIRAELRRLGIANALIELALDSLLKEQDVLDRVLLEAQKRLRRLRKEKDLVKKRRKLFDFLLRRGHTPDVVREVIDKIDLEAE